MTTQKQTKPTKVHSDTGLDDIQINHLFYDQTSLSPTFEELQTLLVFTIPNSNIQGLGLSLSQL